MELREEENAAKLADLEHLAALEKTTVQPSEAPPAGKTRPVKQQSKVNASQADFGF
jgi:hypothetical protein